VTTQLQLIIIIIAIIKLLLLEHFYLSGSVQHEARENCVMTSLLFVRRIPRQILLGQTHQEIRLCRSVFEAHMEG